MLVGNDDPGVEIAGFLYKRRGGFGKHMPNCWQLRYFTISNGILNYYDSIEDSKPRGRLDLTSDKLTFSVGTIIDNSPTIYTIQLIPYPLESEKWKLCTESKQELKRWTNCMEKYIEGEGRPRGASHPPLMNFESNRLMAAPLDDDDDDDDRDQVEPSGLPQKPPRPLTLPERNTNLSEIIKNNNSPDKNQPSRASMPILRSNTNLKSSPVIKPTPFASSSAPSTTTKSKKRLKLKSSENSIKPEQFESIMVFIIMNSCFIMALTSSIIMSLIYLSIANIVVGRTLLLRAARIATNIPSVTSDVTKNNPKNSNKNIPKRSGIYDDEETVETVNVQTTDNISTTTTSTGGGTIVNISNNDINNSNQQSTVISSMNERIVSKSKVRFEGEEIPSVTSITSEQPQLSQITTSTTTTTTATTLGVTDPLANIKPVVGSTLSQVYTIPPNVPEHTWRRCDHKQFNVRVGPDYNRYKRKAPSDTPIYEAIAVDVFCTKERVDFVSQRMTLPDVSDMNTHHPFVPPLFVIQIQIPSEPPPVFGTVEDGPGWAIVMTYKITKESCEQLKDMSTASPAIKLFAKWCERAPVDPTWRGRFKVINSCLNLEELGMPQIVMSYNAKPVLIRRTGTLFRGVGLLEMDIHVHKFASLAKRSIHLISSKCGLMYMQIGFVIEGREENELPETLFACVGVNRPQEDRADFLFEPDEDEEDEEGNDD